MREDAVEGYRVEMRDRHPRRYKNGDKAIVYFIKGPGGERNGREKRLSKRR